MGYVYETKGGNVRIMIWGRAVGVIDVKKETTHRAFLNSIMIIQNFRDNISHVIVSPMIELHYSDKAITYSPERSVRTVNIDIEGVNIQNIINELKERNMFAIADQVTNETPIIDLTR